MNNNNNNNREFVQYLNAEDIVGLVNAINKNRTDYVQIKRFLSECFDKQKNNLPLQNESLIQRLFDTFCLCVNNQESKLVYAPTKILAGDAYSLYEKENRRGIHKIDAIARPAFDEWIRENNPKHLFLNNNTFPSDENEFIHKIKQGEYSNTEWVNGKYGKFSYDAIGNCYKFHECQLVNGTWKRKHFDKSLSPVLAKGFIAFLIYNFENTGIIKTVTDYYDKYYTPLVLKYKEREQIKLGSNTRNLDAEFYEIHFKEEKINIEQSEKLLSFITQSEQRLINDHVNCYFEYIRKFASAKIATPQPETAKQRRPRTIDADKLKPYFSSAFKGMGQSLNYFDTMIEELKTYRTDKEFAEIAFMIYKSDKMSDRKPKTFAKWYCIFCECIGIIKNEYKPNKLKNPSPELKRLFGYL